MPIEIKELHIRVSVNAAAEGRTAVSDRGSLDAGDEGRDALVAECVEQVLQILRSRTER